MTRGVAGAEIDLQLAVAHCHLVALRQPAVRAEGGGVGKTEHLALLGQHVEPEGVFLVGTDDLDPGLLAQWVGAPHVIQMTVGQDDLLQYQVVPGDGRQQLVCLTTGIDQRRLAGLVAPDEGAVLGERGDRDHLEFQHAGVS
ncbi:hypothetical protein D3C72_1713770 [compost metagenome]